MSEIKLGVQLFTLRDKCQTAEDFEETLKFLQSIGCNVIQISAIGPIDPVIVVESGKNDSYIEDTVIGVNTADAELETKNGCNDFLAAISYAVVKTSSFINLTLPGSKWLRTMFLLAVSSAL